MKVVYNNKAVFLWAFLLTMTWSACKQEQLPLYDSGRYVQFDADLRDSISMSFFFHPGKTEVDIPLPVKLIGQLGVQDQKYGIEVVNEMSSVSPQHYRLSTEQVFRKQRARDTAWVTVRNTSDLMQRTRRLVLRIVGDEQMAPGQTTYTYKIIQISDMVSKPTWWDNNMDRFYLGRYSEAKFRKFMEVTGVGDLEPLNSSERLVLMLQFKYYLIEQKDNGTPLFMEDGADMLSTVPLIG